MSMVFEILFAWKARSTHHMLALDALRHLQSPLQEKWERCFLGYIDPFLDGAKAPDTQFKDFCNHVLHPGDKYWGGAVAATEKWYAQAVEAFKVGDWEQGVYRAGVMSHYFTDVYMPFHTGQTEQEGVVHRAAEWSVCKSYTEILDLIEDSLGGYPQVEVPSDEDWLAQMVRRGAEHSHRHYQTLIDHYNIEVGRKRPTEGFDTTGQAALADVISHAIVGLARIFDRMIRDAGVTPPEVTLTPQILMATLTVPIQWVTQNIADRKQAAIVEAIYREYQATGKVVHALPEDDRVVRKAHAREVLHVPVFTLDKQAIDPPGSLYVDDDEPPRRSRAKPAVERDDDSKVNEPAASSEEAYVDSQGMRWYLRESDPVEKAPSIGPKTAKRLAKLEIETVSDLLAIDPDEAAEALGVRHITAETVRGWQAQAQLVCDVPNLRGHDAQILVGCGIDSADRLASSQSDSLLPMVEAFANTREGQWITRSKVPDLSEVTNWVIWASQRKRRARAA